MSWTTASAIAAGLSGSTMRASVPSRSTSGIAPTLVATTGHPATSASGATRPNGSLKRAGFTTTSAAAYTSATRSTKPARTTRSDSPRSSASDITPSQNWRSSAFGWGAPTSARAARGKRLCRRSSARTTRSCPRPAAMFPTTAISGRRPRGRGRPGRPPVADPRGRARCPDRAPARGRDRSP